MSKYSNVVTYEKDCTERCKSNEHGSCITSAITKRNITDKQLASFIKSVCNNFTQVVDYEGRNALHMASACGRKELCQWLVRCAQADINAKDTECGFTALHRCIFYGQLHVTIALMKLGANGHVMDKDDLQPSDHAMKDRAGGNVYSAHNPCQVYVWGTNTNYTLGTGNQHSRPQPDLLELFRKNNVSIKQAAMDKFHSVFVSDKGRAWACGHGQGGRLGLDTEKTILKPQPIKTGTEVVVAASVGRDHTILLMESGAVWTCGLNTYRVLAHSPPPVSLLAPRVVNPKFLKALGGPILGICAARYHSVFWSKSAVLTCGLHGGQLGHPALPDATITIPRQVSGLAHKQWNITHVAVSDGATVVAIKKGDIYVLHQYQTRKIASRQLGVVKLAVVGGQLNSKLDPKLTDRGGHELQVLALMNSGNLMYWQESLPQFYRCIVPFHRGLVFKEIILNRANMMLVTEDGEAFQATVRPKNKKKQSISPAKNPATDSVEEFHHLKLTRLPNVHRAVSVATDPKGQNFAVVQTHPKADLTDIPVLGESELAQHLSALLEEAHEDDTLHDIVFQIGVRKFPAHRYVLALSSEDLASMKTDILGDAVDLPNVDANIFQQILLFAYTGDCDLLHPGPCTIHVEQGDVIKAAIELCKKFLVTDLLKRLQALRYEDGMILLRESRELESWTPPKLDRKLYPEFYDTKIASNDGATFRAHRCILAARLEYFHSMFGGGWIESEAMSSLSLPLPQTVLREILDFLYLDESPSLIECEDVDYISSVLIVADQMFISRLKEICEVALSGVLSLRNAAYMLQLSSTCNAEQLKHCCMQFISLNLPAVLESRTLEVVDSNVLEELSPYYKMMIPAMLKRIITPFSIAPSDEDIISVIDAAPAVPWLCEEGEEDEEPQTVVKSNSKLSNSTVGKLGKKKTTRMRKTSNTEVQRRRYESVSSNSDLDVSTEVQSHRVSFEEFEEHTQQEWTTVDNKMKSILQSRLKAIIMAPSILPPQEDFAKLLPLSKIIEKDVYPDLILEDANEFPQLSDMCTQQKDGGSSSNKKSAIMNSGEVKRSPPIKLSQKQRKKLASEGKLPGENILSKSQSPPTRAWAVLNNPECSFVDILKQTKFGSPSSENSHMRAVETAVTPNFSDIIADELQQRDNLAKMKTKSLQLTQLEDKAMEDLLSFYNASNVFDERITVQRVLTTNIARPTWITNRRR